ncbi:MAG: hypothetical protein F2817_19920 [Actinobacteria bacterium]|nr:hypothetical protein [Actinomycetota bacterium]
MQETQWLQGINFRFGLFVRQLTHSRSSSPASTSDINPFGNRGLLAGADAPRYGVLGICIGRIGAATTIGATVGCNGEPGRAGCGGCGCGCACGGCGLLRHFCLAFTNASLDCAAISSV